MDVTMLGPSALEKWDGQSWNATAFYELAELARLAYHETPPFQRRHARLAGWWDVEPLSIGAAQACIVTGPRATVIACRGSSEWQDWRDDVRIWPRRWRPVLPKEAWVAHGFRRQAIALSELVLHHLSRQHATTPGEALGYRKPRVFLTGHSLGAALCPLLYAYLRSESIVEPVASVAFSPPRVGNDGFRHHLEVELGAVRRLWSVVNTANGEADLVTRVPKKRWGFRHVGRRVIFGGGPAHRTLFGEQAWQDYRQAHPVPERVAAWRLVSRALRRTWAATRAHDVDAMVSALAARR